MHSGVCGISCVSCRRAVFDNAHVIYFRKETYHEIVLGSVPISGLGIKTDTDDVTIVASDMQSGKPIYGVMNSETFYEMDTKKVYIFDEENKK